MQLYVYEKTVCVHTRRELYLDAKGGGLWAGGLGGGGGLCGGLEQSFEDGLGVHLWGGLRGGSLTGGARQGGGQAVFFCTAACAGSIAEPPVGVEERGWDVKTMQNSYFLKLQTQEPMAFMFSCKAFLITSDLLSKLNVTGQLETQSTAWAE